ncbi:glutamate-ammonia-ligase adenylyltransferase [Roseiarcus fermentans]|uniref:Bifunctional glutamine synthetase adenylyltransferase/adenylyl-removing enzyme n=1 Tax=Roseiarcus fermentans TaxID=1473586 RepID=A0A366FM19_9HYPH|nr:bifunctional [glutamine synthetase] adenylyltransferase/[glutamine synthetase]-adenylyl-L-tyrosine phosphorylase [Roseiarcus fermentans]RBP15621.1 glutamate-ammonia-ligase adenylyltransferase [Roseiarcus fermentans]
MNRSLGERLVTAPRLSAPAAARRKLEALVGAPEGRDLAPLVAEGKARDLLLGLADHSPYLWALAGEDPARLARLLSHSPERALDALVAGLSRRMNDEAEAMRALRLAKRESALLIALADIGGVWDVVETTEALTRFADAAVGAALAFLVRQNALAGRLALDPEAPDLQAACGLTVLALGKHGARELNYSSDIDLIVLYDAASAAIPPGAEPAPLYVRITQALARLLQERTSDGYVLRVDLRLRPDPASTPVALSTLSAYAYYETLGQNWERAAMIKARPAAGDLELGDRFLADLSPFVWRKYFDYAAIADIHAMKRQIHAVRGHERVVVAGHDVKLGRGGIREVEFFVQTQQLIFGGRRPRMRGRRTLDMLKELYAEKWVTAEAVSDLTEAYGFLRTVEHRLQMVADEQTQRLPFERADLARFARFCGYGRLESFARDLTFHLTRVETHYARLFEDAPALSVASGSLVFTGVTDDPATLATLRRLGFQHPEAAAETIRGWHFGRRAGVRSPRAREVLTELTPALLEAFAGSGDPAAALAAFDAAMAHMTASVELLSILRSNERLRELFGDVLGSAPRLAEVIASRPHVLDAAIDPDRTIDFEDSFREEATRLRAETYVGQARNFEDALDRARDFAAEEMFLIGLNLLSGRLDPDRAGQAYSALAAAMVGALLKRVAADFAQDHGVIAGGRVAVLAMGKLGSREMTAASDLDLILIYDFPETAGESDGARPLGPGVYYARFTQRLLAALTAKTRRGALYEVDMRLRPSGRKGPLATQFSAFARYQRDEAETWEHMALTRARIVAGEASLAAEATKAIRATLTRRRDPGEVAREVTTMRALIAREKGESDPWDLKLVKGGLMDIEFVAQYLALAFGHDRPDILDVSTRAAIDKAGRAKLLDSRHVETLLEAHRLYTDATQFMRLAISGPFDPKTAASGVKRRIAASSGFPDFEAFIAALDERRRKVRETYEAVLKG